MMVISWPVGGRLSVLLSFLPSFLYTHLSVQGGIGAGALQRSIGERRGTSWPDLQSITRQHRKTCRHTHQNNVDRPVNLTDMFLDCGSPYFLFLKELLLIFCFWSIEHYLVFGLKYISELVVRYEPCRSLGSSEPKKAPGGPA
ncbi:hypothetical protein AMECASPLE_025475 [Ameca splendens]|uniref:Secreted protein n=1 Tax=Ameca splendens TaxID=208324 RepID=A0ABV0XTR5_9TELE